MGRAAEARDLAGRALSLDPGTAAAHESLALLAWREGKRIEARDALARATALPGASDYAHYLYGHLLWESLEGSEDLLRVEASFRRATELNPSFAGAHASLARAMAARGAPLAETLPLAVRAARLEPGEIDHSLTALRLAAQGGGVREARAQAEALLARSEGDDRPKVEALLRELVESPPPPRVATVTEGAGEGANVAPGTGTAGLVSGEEGKAAAPTSVTVALEFLVEDLRGTPVSDIRLEEVEVVQDATRQRIRTFEAKSRPGRYELTYAPRSGKAGGVTVRVTRRGTVMRGPDGGSSLKPRVISALSPLETELTGVLEARPGAGDLACHVAVLRFEPTASGVRHAVAVEIPLSELRFERAPTGARGRLQVLARARSDVDPAVLQHVTMDQILEAAGDGVVGVQRLVWTGTLVIGPGRHTIDVLVRDPAANRATTRTLAVEVPPPVDGLRVSSVALLRPRSFFFLRDQVQGDDPLEAASASL